jgi:protein-disulfide isomerase
VTLVEYGDVECPHCRSLEPVLRALLEERADVRLVYRHFPLVDLHENAYASALAMEAAAVHGRFWELHDLLLAPGAPLGRRALTAYAERLELDPVPLLRPQSDVHDPKVRSDFEGGVRSGVVGTPGLFVDGRRVVRPPTLTHLNELVEAAALR